MGQVLKYDSTFASLSSAIANAHPGDAIVPNAPGTIICPSALPLINPPGVFLDLTGQILRMPLKVLQTGPVMLQRVAALNSLGIAANLSTLTPAQASAMNARIADTTKPALDTAGVAAAIAAATASLAPITDARMFDAKPQRSLTFTFNGLSYTIGLGWGSGVAKGLIMLAPTAWGTQIQGGTIQNVRQEGSSYNGTGIYAQGVDNRITGTTFEDCEDGIRTSDQSIINPAGDWFREPDLVNHYDQLGFNINLDCTFDNCGAGGNSHGEYLGPALLNLSVRPRVIRTNAGNALKLHGGVQIVIGAQVGDLTDTNGELQAVDMDCCASYIINSVLLKATAGTGNHGSVTLMRNDREPIPSWMDSAHVVRGNVITSTVPMGTCFVRAINGAKFTQWPGVPVPLRCLVTDNVFLSNAGSQASKTPYQLPADAVTARNQNLTIGATYADPKIPLPDYKFAPDTYQDEVVDLINKVDPGRPWVTRWRSLPVRPAGVVVPGSTLPPAPAPAPQPAPPPPTPAEDPAVIQQLTDALAAANASITALNQQIAANDAADAKALADMTSDRDAQKTRADTAEGKIAAAKQALG